MGWIEQCGAILKVKADAINMMKPKNNQGINVVIKQLSKESGVPFTTLKRWYLNNGNRPTCIKCNKRPVHTTNMGRFLTKASKYYGLCTACRLLKIKMGDKNGKHQIR